MIAHVCYDDFATGWHDVCLCRKRFKRVFDSRFDDDVIEHILLYESSDMLTQ